jgi:hypothetical protein
VVCGDSHGLIWEPAVRAASVYRHVELRRKARDVGCDPFLTVAKYQH